MHIEYASHFLEPRKNSIYLGNPKTRDKMIKFIIVYSILLFNALQLFLKDVNLFLDKFTRAREVEFSNKKELGEKRKS